MKREGGAILLGKNLSVMVSMTIEEAYQILGVSSSSEESVVKTAYKRLALQTHPDKNPNDPNSREKFQRVSEAYKRITDPDAFKDEEEVEFDDLNEMFTAMFSEMMPMMFGGMGGGHGGGGMDGIPFEMMEMMMAGMMMEEMGMGGMSGMMPGMAGEDVDSDDEEMDLRAMEAFLAAGGMGGGMGGMSFMMGDSEDEEEDDDDDDDDRAYRSASDAMGFGGRGGGGLRGMSLEDVMMSQLLSGGAGLDIDELAYMMGAAEDVGGRGGGRPGRSGANRNVSGRGNPGPRLHSSMYKDAPMGGRAGWVTDSDQSEEEQGAAKTTSTGPRVTKKKKKSSKKKKKSTTKNKASETSASASATAPRDDPNPSPREPTYGDRDPLASTDHYSSRFSSSASSSKQPMRPPVASHYDDDDEEEDDEDITADELADLMAAMLGGLGGGGGPAQKGTGRGKKGPATSGRGQTQPDHRKSSHSSSSVKKGGTINHSSGAGPSFSAGPAASGSEGEEECFLRVGDKVLVHGRHAGTVAFKGSVQYAQGEFVGVIMDEEVGKNNGTIKGKKYFSCPSRRGLMVRPNEMRPLSLGDDV